MRNTSFHGREVKNLRFEFSRCILQKVQWCCFIDIQIKKQFTQGFTVKFSFFFIGFPNPFWLANDIMFETR